MKQTNWEYFDEKLKRHLIGLLHGQDTGHVVIHVNGKVTFIDFKVHAAKTYRILINNIPIQIVINKEDENYNYELVIDKDTPTPTNIARKAKNKRHRWQTIAFIAAFILIIALLTYYFSI